MYGGKGMVNPGHTEGVPVKAIVVVLPTRVKMRLRRLRRATDDAGLAMRCQIILHAGKGRTAPRIAEMVGCHSSWAWRVIRRFRQDGEAGLYDRREDNGQQKLDDWYLGKRIEVVGKRPSDPLRGQCSRGKESSPECSVNSHLRPLVYPVFLFGVWGERGPSIRPQAKPHTHRYPAASACTPPASSAAARRRSR